MTETKFAIGERESDKLAYTIGILNNRLDLRERGLERNMSYWIRQAADNGVSYSVLQDEARMAHSYSQYRQRIEELWNHD